MGETYLIFHQLDGRLYGYFGLYKSMQEIKADGTFYDRYLYSTEWDRQSVGYSRVSFTETGIEFHPFTYSVSPPGNLPEDEKYVYVVDGKTASLHNRAQSPNTAFHFLGGITYRRGTQALTGTDTGLHVFVL